MSDDGHRWLVIASHIVIDERDNGCRINKGFYRNCINFVNSRKHAFTFVILNIKASVRFYLSATGLAMFSNISSCLTA